MREFRCFFLLLHFVYHFWWQSIRKKKNRWILISTLYSTFVSYVREFLHIKQWNHHSWIRMKIDGIGALKSKCAQLRATKIVPNTQNTQTVCFSSSGRIKGNNHTDDESSIVSSTHSRRHNYFNFFLLFYFLFEMKKKKNKKINSQNAIIITQK